MSEDVYLKDYSPFPASIKHCELTFDIQKDFVVVTTNLFLEVEDSKIFFDGEDLELLSLSFNQEPLSAESFEVQPKGLLLKDLPSSGQLSYQVRLNPWKNKQCSGLYRSGDILVTQCEAEGFRRITYFPDRPDVMTTYQVKVIASKKDYPILLSNGNLIESGELEQGRHYSLFHDPHRKPSYLFALALGDFATVSKEFTTCSGKKVTLMLHTEKADSQKTEFALDALEKAMVWDEKVYGLEYDLSVYHIVAASHFNMGAMENKGLNVFNSKYILGCTKTITDLDYKNIYAIVAHEYFHNWTGNRVTLRDWFQLSLKEGLTVFREQEFMEDFIGIEQSRIEDVKRLKEAQFTEDTSAFAHPIRPQSYRAIDNFYTATIYEKGAEVIRVLRQLVGRKTFNQGVRAYLETYDGKAATLENWIEVFEKITGKSLKQFSRWYDVAGLLKIEILYQEEKVRVVQTHSSKENLLIPLTYQWFERGRTPQEVQTLWFDKSFVELERPSETAVLMINHEFAVPALIDYGLSMQDLEACILSESESLLTWQLMQEKWLSLFEATTLDNKSAQKTFFLSLLERYESRPALLAALLKIPSYQSLLIQKTLSPTEYLSKTKILREQIGEWVRPRACTYIESHDPRGWNEHDMACRQLILMFLEYLASTEQGYGLVNAVYQRDLLTYKIGVIEALSYQQKTTAFDKILEDYQQSYGTDKLLSLPYYKAVAKYGGKEALEGVEKLLKSPGFDKDSPNDTYALLGSFLGQNHDFIHHHPKSFEIWSFWLCYYDKQNPQVCARLISLYKNLNCWPEQQRNKLAHTIVSLEKKIEHRQSRELLEKLKQSCL